ncbi:MarR family transcriptional regulator [Luteolibacter luteus]|uniref:MarR family transcriptional regulator n=2 Tax=Luteolibacter luteus TaxID=2728835 RepID=A0A858RPF3_9BACT|nr:MarR family transcriptional regulator [Luteolibacter luteus]
MRVLVHLWRRGRTYSNASTIASICRLKRETVFSVLKELETAGLIRRESRPGQTTLIEPVSPNGTGSEINPSPQTGQVSADLFPQTGREVSPESGRVEENPSPQTGRHPSPQTGHKGTPSKVPPKKRKSTSKLSDADWIDSLRKDPSFEGLDIDGEIERASVWIARHPGRSLTRRFITNWLSRADRPLNLQAAKTAEQSSEDQIGDRTGTFIPIEE